MTRKWKVKNKVPTSIDVQLRPKEEQEKGGGYSSVVPSCLVLPGCAVLVCDVVWIVCYLFIEMGLGNYKPKYISEGKEKEGGNFSILTPFFLFHSTYPRANCREVRSTYSTVVVVLLSNRRAN